MTVPRSTRALASALVIAGCTSTTPAARVPQVVRCPATLGTGPSALRLLGARIVEGDPEGAVVLAPSSMTRAADTVVNRWDLAPYRRAGLYLRCLYEGGKTGPPTTLLSSVTTCEARGPVDAVGRVIAFVDVVCR